MDDLDDLDAFVQQRRKEFAQGASRPAHTSTTAAGFNHVPSQHGTKGLRRILEEGTKTIGPDVPLNTHQHRLVAGTLDHIRAGGSTKGAPDPLVSVHPDGSHWVMDGHHRIAVAREQGRPIKVGYRKLGF